MDSEKKGALRNLTFVMRQVFEKVLEKQKEFSTCFVALSKKSLQPSQEKRHHRCIEIKRN